MGQSGISQLGICWVMQADPKTQRSATMPKPNFQFHCVQMEVSMDKKISLDHLLEIELKKLMATEQLTYEGLSDMIDVCSSKELLSILSTHREETSRQKSVSSTR